jgi:hypothetical protein
MLFESGNLAFIPLPITQFNISDDKINIYLLKFQIKVSVSYRIARTAIVKVTVGHNTFRIGSKLGLSLKKTCNASTKN